MQQALRPLIEVEVFSFWAYWTILHKNALVLNLYLQTRHFDEIRYTSMYTFNAQVHTEKPVAFLQFLEFHQSLRLQHYYAALGSQTASLPEAMQEEIAAENEAKQRKKLGGKSSNSLNAVHPDSGSRYESRKSLGGLQSRKSLGMRPESPKTGNVQMANLNAQGSPR